MKLLRSKACSSAVGQGNVSRRTVMGEAWMDRLSDRGSIPLRSIWKVLRIVDSRHFFWVLGGKLGCFLMFSPHFWK